MERYYQYRGEDRIFLRVLEYYITKCRIGFECIDSRDVDEDEGCNIIIANVDDDLIFLCHEKESGIIYFNEPFFLNISNVVSVEEIEFRHDLLITYVDFMMGVVEKYTGLSLDPLKYEWVGLTDNLELDDPLDVKFKKVYNISLD